MDAIVKKVHDKHGLTGLFSKARKPVIKQGETEDYADKMFYWETFNPAVAKLVKEVKERMEKLREYGLAEKMLLALLKTEQKLSKLVVTRDFRIILPDYNNMEIKMEPLVKAVYLLFLRHPEGIVFKNLPDYRQELTQIYVKLKPYGINDRVIRSIEDVTNPLLNSINEKCARIRGLLSPNLVIIWLDITILMVNVVKKRKSPFLVIWSSGKPIKVASLVEA